MWRAVAGDALLGGAMAALMILAAGTSGDEPARPLDGWSVAAILAIGSWAALARHAPRTATVGATLTFYAALAFGVPAFSPALALGVPVFVAARWGHLWWGIGVLAVVGATSAPYRWFGPGDEPLAQVALTTLYDLALVGILLLLGDTLRSRQALARSAEMRLLLAEQEHQQRLTRERLRVTGELHDVLSHTVALVGIQAAVAAETIDSDPDLATQAIDRVRTATREAAADLRTTIALLREEPPDELSPTPGIDQLPDLVEGFRAAGLEARLSVAGCTGRLRPSVDLAVYRIVQESLTNVLRHSTASTVDVSVECATDAVEVTVRDDGTTDRSRPDQVTTEGTGSGLRGMTERVTALGGRLDHGPAGDDHEAYRVRARIPLGGAAP